MKAKGQYKDLPRTMQDTIYHAHISIMAGHDLQFCMQCMGGKYTVPIPEAEAEDLYLELNKRFISWTGKGLKTWANRK